MKVKKEQADHKLKVVTVGYSPGGLMTEEIITLTIMWDLPNYSRRISHHTQRQFCTGFYHILFFTNIFQLMVEQTNLYYQKYLYKQSPPHCLPDITLTDIITVFALVLQMGNILQDKLQDHWSRLEQFYIPFYDYTMIQILAYTAIFCILRTTAKDLTKKKRNKTM